MLIPPIHIKTVSLSNINHIWYFTQEFVSYHKHKISLIILTFIVITENHISILNQWFRVYHLN